uniref:Integrase_H2C2 domain-containing protein n=1 Tax=Strongyloides venezuelensis TaxID=75913 RepID=A0A0K0FX86_STRVS
MGEDIPVNNVKAGEIKLMEEAMTPYELNEEIENAQKNLEECQILRKCVSQGWSTVTEEVLNQCYICMRAKCSNHKRPISWSPPKHAREREHFDLFYIDKQVLILFVNVFSKFTYIGVLKDKKVESFVNFFDKTYIRLGRTAEKS